TQRVGPSRTSTRRAMSFGSKHTSKAQQIIPDARHDPQLLRDTVLSIKASFRSLENSGNFLEHKVSRSRTRILGQLLAARHAALEETPLKPVLPTMPWSTPRMDSRPTAVVYAKARAAQEVQRTESRPLKVTMQEVDSDAESDCSDSSSDISKLDLEARAAELAEPDWPGDSDRRRNSGTAGDEESQSENSQDLLLEDEESPAIARSARGSIASSIAAGCVSVKTSSVRWLQLQQEPHDTPGCSLHHSSGCLAPERVFVAALCAAGATKRLRDCSRRQNHPKEPEPSRAELLVDADTHSIDEIRAGIALLKLEKEVVHTTVFAAPGFARNKKWQRFFRETKVSFRPVRRSSILRDEANDDAIIARVRKMCNSKAAVCIALLVSDKDYAGAMQEALLHDKVVLAICPKNRHPVITAFEEIGVRVLSLPTTGSISKIRAVLSEDGDGYVHLAEAYHSPPAGKEAETVCEFLGPLGYLRDESRYLIHPMAKFWFTNSLGAFTVFPQRIAMQAVCALREGGREPETGWKAPETRMAFFLPVTHRRPTQTKASRFGSSLACSIFEGGGPFLLQDSRDLIARALNRLGYLDSSLNGDISEALFVFVNRNKQTLRKLDALPCQSDQASTVEDELRHIFLSNGSSGQWNVAPEDIAVREHLCKQGFLHDVTADRNTVFQAMRNYASSEALPDMKTYSGYSLRIMAGLNRSDNRRGLVEFQL
ncbi:unnamed protein product, partial [Symbiodinium microadriaticum]